MQSRNDQNNSDFRGTGGPPVNRRYSGTNTGEPPVPQGDASPLDGRPARGTRSATVVFTTIVMLLAFTPALRAAPEAVSPGTGLHMDPAKVVGSGKCAECHKAEDNAWQ
ncbi:MAG: hypothetical protein JWO87_3380, partial [Phycisphaerales bacterium]|nr:hypothetical protein [Phycisphaerales bacterium]